MNAKASGRDRQRIRSEEGAVIVEAGIALPVLFLLVVGIIQFSLIFWQLNQMRFAVSEAARYVMVNKALAIGTLQTNAESWIETIAPFANGTATPANCSAGISGMQLTATSTSSLGFIVPVTTPVVRTCVPLL
jgi:Flp pilus assembly protein TadG